MPETGKPEEKTGGKEIRISAEIEKYAVAVAKDPKSRAFAPLAEAYRRAGMLDEAIMVAQDGLKIHPAYHSGRVALGRAYFEKGMLVEAATELETVTKSSPDNIVAQKVLGEIFFRQGDKEKARRLFSLVLTLSPGDKEAEEKLKALTQPLPAPEPVPEPVTDTVPPPAPQPEPEAKPVSETPPEPASETQKVSTPESVSAAAPPPIPEPDDLVSEALDRSQAEQTAEKEAAVQPVPAPEPQPEPEKPSDQSDQSDSSDLVPESEIPGDLSLPEEPDEDLAAEILELSGAEPAEPLVPAEIEFDEPEKSPDLSDQSDSSGLASEAVSEPVAETLPELAIDTAVDTDTDTDTLADKSGRLGQADTDTELETEARAENIATPTIAEIYVKQGHLDKALEVYREILAADPGAREIVQRVVELSRLTSGETGSDPGLPAVTGAATPTERKIRFLKNWLQNIQNLREQKH